MTPDDAIERALSELRDAVRLRVRAEQLVDRLTGLANDEALGELLKACIEQGEHFWLAFIEVDKFKSLNDEYGYDEADGFLRRIAEKMRLSAQHNFVGTVVPFRAHGDEFFMLGRGSSDPSDIEEALEHLCREVAQIRVTVRGCERPMRGTVSIGWLCSMDSSATQAGLTWRSVRTHAELAVAEAKQERNRVVRFRLDMQRAERREARADCGDCTTKFPLSVPIGAEKDGSLLCPNCGREVVRPASVSRPPAPPAPSDVN